MLIITRAAVYKLIFPILLEMLGTRIPAPKAPNKPMKLRIKS